MAVLCAFSLSACVGKSDSASSGGASATVDASCEKKADLVLKTNSIQGGKSAANAEWIQSWLIPNFEKYEKDKGNAVTLKFEGDGSDDEAYKTKVSLDLKTGGGADVVSIDGIWVGEFAQAGYIKPLEDTLGAKTVDAWDGWKQIPKPVQGILTFEDKRYGLPAGTDGRVLYFNKTAFAKAGLPGDWQPKSWADILDAGEKLKAAGIPTPIQLNAGTAMGEATSMQAVLPLLVGTGKEIYSDGKWLGDTPQLRAVLQMYADIYGEKKLGDPLLQQEEKGRDKSFTDFAAGQVGILVESDYFWRSVVEPKNGVAPMADRDSAVGWAYIPAEKPGSGIKGQDYVSMSGGGGNVLNPKSKCVAAAWSLMTFMASKDATISALQGDARITSRTDVNDEVLAGDKMLSFVADKVLPITDFRPGLADYPQVSMALQEATGAVASGTSVEDAAAAYQAALEKTVGKDNVTSS